MIQFRTSELCSFELCGFFNVERSIPLCWTGWTIRKSSWKFGWLIVKLLMEQEKLSPISVLSYLPFPLIHFPRSQNISYSIRIHLIPSEISILKAVHSPPRHLHFMKWSIPSFSYLRKALSMNNEWNDIVVVVAKLVRYNFYHNHWFIYSSHHKNNLKDPPM